MTLKVAVTGGTGFAGRFILSELVAQGHQVSALVRNPARAQVAEGIQLVPGDLADGRALRELCQRADVVIHVAGAISGLSAEDYFRVNRDGTRAVAEAALAEGVRRLVHISSLAARQPELSPYAASKRASESVVLDLMPMEGLFILRPAAIYGPGDRATLPLFKELTRPVAVVPGRRGQRFSLIHGADFARVVARAAASDVVGLREVGDTTRGGHDWNDLAAAARKIHGVPRRLVHLPKAVPAMVAVAAEAWARHRQSPSMINRGKINELYFSGDWVVRGDGWPRADAIRLEEGMAETFAWYRAHGWLPSAKHQ
jgi:nucleoside-diphosphate-sugar epimerase